LLSHHIARTALAGGWDCLDCASCGLFIAATAAQNSPVNVRAQVFAAHLPVGGALNDRAMFCSQWTHAMHPLMHHAGRHAQLSRQMGLTAKNVGSQFDGLLGHAVNVASLHRLNQALLHFILYSIAR